MGRIENKVALVTGAASGLGYADAQRLAEEGAKVVLTDVNEEMGREVASTIPGSLFLVQDVRDERRWEAVIAETMAHFGRLDVLVNNAGLVRFADIEQIELDEFRFHHAVMTEGTLLGCKYAIPTMRLGGGGSIINVSSVGAVKGIGEIVAYAAAKGAILSMTRSIAVHCQNHGYGIRCNAIAPGAHDTPMTAQAMQQVDDDSNGMEQIKSLGQGQPVDVANLVLFLASDESRNINGAQLVIDNCETIR
ncbi:SDR family NAD(P)-dependent oxidoreductase [Pseudomonas profundi]|uniref:SDR family NAD(P)-dependent oxidoreductase n=1 Tax=Pseudomonas profundi TaxID=1981513 RepID=UPI00123B856B|nr:SDR family oxidoreductase [Pseudomonas profundi]